MMCGRSMNGPVLRGTRNYSNTHDTGHCNSATNRLLVPMNEPGRGASFLDHSPLTCKRVPGGNDQG